MIPSSELDQLIQGILNDIDDDELGERLVSRGQILPSKVFLSEYQINGKVNNFLSGGSYNLEIDESLSEGQKDILRQKKEELEAEPSAELKEQYSDR